LFFDIFTNIFSNSVQIRNDLLVIYFDNVFILMKAIVKEILRKDSICKL